MAQDGDTTDWDNWTYDENDDGTVKTQDIEEELVFKDANGNILQAGDSVAAIKDLAVKGASDIKRGDKFKNIKLTDDIELIESGKMVLRTEYFKKI
jgi:protein PhnA